MKKIKDPRIFLFLLLAVLFCLAFVPGQLQAGGTDDSDKANNLFMYADDANGNKVLLKVIPLSTLKSMMHGQDGTVNSTCYGSFIDSYPTPTYCEGKGVTITELLDYTLAQTSVANAGGLTYQDSDRLYFYSCDGPENPVNYTYNALLGVDRFYFPRLYHYWDAEEGEISDVDAVLGEKYEMTPYLAVESLGGRVFGNAGGNNISGYVADNGGVVAGCLRDELEDTESLRLVLPQTEEDIEESEPTYSGIRKWVYKVRLRESGTSPITSLGTVSDPTYTYTLSGNTLTITMNCADSGAFIYYSTIGGHTQTPVNLYTGPITVDDYDSDEPFTLGVVAVQEGYADSAVIEADSVNISDDPDDPSFLYALAADTEDIETGEDFTVAATLSADKDYTLYGAEYRIAIPTAAFSVGVVSSEDGWEYGTASDSDDTIVTFTYLNTEGQAVVADTPLDIGSISLTPLQAGTATITVSEAIVTREDSGDYNSVTAEDFTVEVEAASSGDTTIDLADFVGGIYPISEGGDYQLAADAAGTIEISTTEAVTITGNGMSGTANSGLTLDCTVSGADLTIDDLYISAPVADKNVIDFTGSGNTLTLSGASLLENNSTSLYYAAIHVPHGGSLTIDGDGTLYVYKNSLGAAIGGDCDTGTDEGETNGDITIAGGTIFAKGSMTGATIGAGQKGTGGKVYITGGVLNLMTKARGAVIGGGGEQGGVHGAGGDVYVSGGTLLLYTDWTGSLIGCGNGNVVYTDGGKVYIGGGSLKTVITSNAGGKWGTSTTENTVSDAAITAVKLNNDTDEEAVYRLFFDTADLAAPADNFTVKVDGEDFYAGAGHEWQVGNPGGTVNGGAFAADTTETNLYFYLTGEDHDLTVNGETFHYTWDPETSTFSPATVPPADDIWDGTADTSWYDAGNPLTAYTIATPKQLAGLASLVNAGNSFAGVTFTLANDITLNSESSTTNWTPIGTASVTVGSNREAIVNSGTPFVGVFDGAGYAINGLYISSAANMQGLFGYLTGTVKDLTVNGGVYSTAAAAGEYATLCVGAVTAFNHGGTIADVTNNAIVDAPNIYFVGGIAGCNLNGTITRSANLAGVTGFQCVGGITGRNGGTITYTYNTGKVDGVNASSKNGVGGIAGKNGNHNTAVETGIIDSCYNAGTVGRSGQKWVGGIAGFQNRLSSIKNCYVSGTVVVGAGRYAAIVGQEEGTSANNYSLDTIASDTQETVIGTKLTDAQLKTAASLLGGSFVNDTVGGGYPLLFWQRGLNLGTITVDSNIANGVVTAPAKATEGNTVTVTVTPSEGYKLIMDSLTYTVVGQDPVVISVTEGVYGFVMPAANVTINAAFETASSGPHIWDGTADTSWYVNAASGTTEFHISTPEELAGLADISNGIGVVNGTETPIPFDDFTGKTVYLDNDIWLNDHTSAGEDSTAHKWEPIGWAYYIDQASGVGVTPFNGTLDGQGHTIYNMYQYQTETYSSPGSEAYKARGVSLIGYSAEACVARNIIITGYCYGNRYVSGIVGKVGTKGLSYSSDVGPGTTVENCVSYVAVTSTGSRGSGGVVGAAWNHPTIRNCVNYGSITGLGTDKQGTVGGVVGESEGLVENCVNYGTVTNITSNFKANAGGVVGNPQSGSCVTRNCYNLGAVSGGTAGGVIGYEQGTSYNCYNLGSVSSATGGVVGGVIGEISGTTNYQTNLYYLETAATAGVGKGGGTKTQVTSFAPGADILNLVNGIGTDFAGRSFVANTTGINGSSYPILRFQTTDTSTLESISIVTSPTKVVYSATEIFNPAGMVVKAHYSDGTSEMISGYTYPTEPLTAETTSVTISYKDKSTTQAITVNALTLDSIAVTTVPTKTFYVNGETFDKIGMVVKATYNGTIVATLDPGDYTVSPDPLTTGTTEVTISYEYQGVTKTATQAITVMEALPELTDECYQIEDALDLLWFADQVSVQGNSAIKAKLVNDLDLTDVNWAVPIGTSAKKFSGIFDGNDKSITSLVKKPVPSSHYGLFGYGYGATIKNLAVTVDLESASQYTAGLAGYAENCTIDHVTINGSIKRTSNTYTGGLTSYSAGSTFIDCVNNARIEVIGNCAAGIAGYASSASTFTDCLNNGVITSSAPYVGGIVGDAAGTTSFTNCRNTAAVTGSYHVGGIVGRQGSTGTILKCANTGTVTTTSTVTSPGYTLGGVAGGLTAAATIDQCYNIGAITGSNSSIGGLAGSMTNASARLTNSYNIGSVTYTGSYVTASIGGVVGYASNAAVTVQNCYNVGKVEADSTTSSYIAGVIGSAAGLTNVSNNYYLNTTATQATGKTTSTDDNAQAKTSSGMRAASFVTALGNLYQLGPIYPALSWEKVVVTDEDVDINDGNPVEIGSAQDTTNIVLGNALVTAIGAANDVSLQLTTSNGEFTFDAEATDGIMAAAGGNDIVFRALQLTESDDPAIQDLIDDDALVFDFSLTTGGNPIFTEGSSSGMVSIRIPYELGSGDPDNIKVYLVNGGVKTPVSATYDNGYIIFSVEHFSIYSIEYQGLKIWAEFDGANTHFNGSDQVTVEIYARGDEAVTYGSYQGDVDFNSAQLTFNSSASAMEDGTSYMNLSAPGKVQIGYSSSESISQNLSAGGTLLATLVFDVQPVATDGSTGSIGISNADFEAGGSAAQDANIGADLGYTLHNIRLTFQAGTGTTLTTTYAYVKYHEAGLYTDAIYAASMNVPVPVAASGYRLAADSELSPLWKDAAGTGYTSADIAAGTFTAGATFTAQASRSGHSSGSGGNTSKKDAEEDIIEEDVQEDDSSPVKSFTDIKENDWYYAAIKFVTDRGLFTGISSTAFEPQTTMSRDMLVTVLYRLEGEPAIGNAASSLSDVNAGSWYANAVAWATANGIITGYDSGKFGPKDPLTREQLLAILYRYSSLKGYDTSASSDLTGFTDSGEIKDYALIPFKWGTGNGLIDGKGAGILDPAGDATRAEVATILMRFINMIQ